jgi:hypothetical protein
VLGAWQEAENRASAAALDPLQSRSTIAISTEFRAARRTGSYTMFHSVNYNLACEARGAR